MFPYFVMMFPCVSIHDMERNLGLGLQFVLGIPYSNVAFGFWACPVVTTSVEWFVTAMLLVVYCGYLGHLVIKHKHLLNHLFLLMFQLLFTVIPFPTETLGEIPDSITRWSRWKFRLQIRQGYHQKCYGKNVQGWNYLRDVFVAPIWSTGTSEHFPYYDTNIRPRWEIAICLIMVTLAPTDVLAKNRSWKSKIQFADYLRFNSFMI